MEHIAAPIIRHDRGPTVHNLQDGLLLFLSAGQMDVEEAARRALSEKLAAEQRAGGYEEVTADLVGRFQRKHLSGLGGGETVDETTAAAMNRILEELHAFTPAQRDDFLVAGRVEFEDGSPGAGLKVVVFDRDIGSKRVRLGESGSEVVTSDTGAFPAVRYRTAAFQEGEGERGASADLVFEVLPAGGEHPLEIAALFRRLVFGGEPVERQVPDLVLGFAAVPVEDVRIVLAGRPAEGGLAEYERLMRALKPVLLDGLTPGDFDQERSRDFDFAARETGWDRPLIETMTLAWQLARTASREPQRLAETFYGLLRHGPPTEVAPLPTNLSELLDRDLQWGRKIEDSLTHRLIGGKAEQHLESLRALRTESSARPGEGRKGSIGDVLAHAGISEDERQKLLGAYHAHKGTVEEFWREVAPARTGWTEEQIGAVQAALHLADLVGYDMPLVKRLHADGFKEARDLARLDRKDWIDLVTHEGPPVDAPGETETDKIERTVDGVIGLIESTYPTEVVAHIAQTSRDPKLAGARDLVTKFFERETAGPEGFDIRTSPVTTYLEEHGDRVFRGLRDDDRKLLTSQLQRLQRVYRLGVNRAQSETLLELGLDSASSIARYSLDHFVGEYGKQLGGPEAARLTYGRAEQIAGTMTYLFIDLWQGLHGYKPPGIMSNTGPDPKSPHKVTEPLKELPEYRDLFGSAQSCACGHCQSMYSPAAYFVDLLHLLDQPKASPENPVEVLFWRRPDLGHIQLTCENTNTLIPYVDLVTEVLESFVANRASVAFNEPPPPPNQRLAAPSAEELRVNPVPLTKASETFADQAYAALQEASFPFTLPLNLPLETTRIYLDHLGARRADLMALLDRDAGLEPQMARAAEILLLSPEEFEVITASTFGGASSLRPATTAELFGLSVADTPTDNPRTLFNHAAPEFVVSVTAPDEREALLRSLQNVLGLISPTAVPVTGKFDTTTEAAVNAVLIAKGLPATGRTDDNFWGTMETDGMKSLSVMLCPVPFFLERTRLTYPELVALVKTRFVNPDLQGTGDLDYLARLGIPAADVRAWIQAGFPALPTAIQTALTTAGEAPNEFEKWVKRRARAVVLNSAFEAPCDLDRTTLMHFDGTLLTPEELVTLFRFIRLWRKLEWTLEEVDLALEPGSLDGPGIFNTIQLLANLQQLRQRLKAPLADLACLWQTIPTHGERPLYDRLFRNRSALLLDPVLELERERTDLKAAGSATPPAIADFTAPLLAAFRLSAQDLAAVREAIGLADDLTLPPATWPRLTLGALSAIYRRVMWARALRLSVRELQALLDLTGLSVFERPDRFPTGNALHFVTIVEKVRAVEVKPGELEYLCRGIVQPPALPGTQRDVWRQTLATLLGGLHGIAAEEPIAEDPTGEQLTARLVPLLGPEDAPVVTALLYGRDVYTAPLAGPAAFVFPAAVAGRVSYDAGRQQLKFRGAMSTTDQLAMLAATGAPPGYPGAVAALDAPARAFVARALKMLFAPGEAETLLIEVPSLGATGQPDLAVIDAKIADLLARRQVLLSRALIKQTLSTTTGLAADIVGLLLTNETVLKAIGGTGPAMGDYQTLDGDGLAAIYYPGITLTGAPIATQTDPAIWFDWAGAPPAPIFSVRWKGRLYVPAAGEVTFHVRCSDGVRVRVNGALVLDEWRDQPATPFSARIRLDGAQFYPIEVEYYNQTGGALLELSWGSPSIPETSIPEAALYTEARQDELLLRVERIYKLAQLLAPFHLTAHELEVLSTRGDVTLDALPLNNPATLPAAQASFQQWLGLFDFAVLRDRFPVGEVSLIDVPAAPTPAEAIERFVTLSGASAEMLAAIVAGFTIPVFSGGAWQMDAPDLTQIAWWSRIAETLALVQRTGAKPPQLFAWAQTREIQQLAAGPDTLWFTWTARDTAAADRSEQNRRLAREARDLVRARYDEDRWRAAARPLNDLLRERRKAALNAFVLAMPEMMMARVTDSGRLFEFFLIDAEMSPCMETSRIVQGIASCQLYCQRVLLNLESPKVPPGRIDRGRWEWMKNYRVWEANRKVLFYAESYCDEEFRDDKTPIFDELESELLQDEMNEPNVERAFRHYLEKLDGIAKLIVCGTCIDTAAETLHVFGRTSTVPFVFYHRRLVSSRTHRWPEGIWSPWQKLPVDVAAIDDGDHTGIHLLPIIWNRRLYLFWLNFEQEPDEESNVKLNLPGFDQIYRWKIKLAWSEYKDDRWSPKQTGVPFIHSRTHVSKRPKTTSTPLHYAPGVVHHEAVYQERFEPPLGGWEPPPGHPNYEKWKRDNTKLVLVRDAYDAISRIVITDDPMLEGVILDKEGDWAHHDHLVETTAVLQLRPKPSSHFLDASINDRELTIRVRCRHKGIQRGQQRETVTDTISVVRDGRRTDRKEQSQEDHPVTYVELSLFREVGHFRFPACGTDLGSLNSESNLDSSYESLERPYFTTNSFMAFRPEHAATSLRLTTSVPDILKKVLTPFEVIDSDNKSGFDRFVPFFYQDQQRCYLVTRDAFADLFEKPEKALVRPDKQLAEVDRTIGLATLQDRKMGIAADASLQASSWAKSGLIRWAARLGASAKVTADAGTLNLSNALAGIDLGVTEQAKDLWDFHYYIRAKYTFTPHWHPYTCAFLGELNRGGLPGLFTLANQSRSDAFLVAGPIWPILTNNFAWIYKPDSNQVVQPYPDELVEFRRSGSYATYNWEIFFHGPLLVATSLSRAGRYEDALRWFHFIFDPMTADGDPSERRYWRFLPLQTADTTRLEDLVNLLSYTGSDPAKLKQKSAMQASIQEWLAHPFRPHVIARGRPVVFMKHVFMKYLDNLIAWADTLFRRDTRESITEATQLYILAANLCGPRIEKIPAPGPVAPETFQTLRKRLNELSTALVNLETRLPFTQLFAPSNGGTGQLTTLPQTQYFCLPQNEQLLAYWDTIADRLFKIRHCRDIDGTVRDLALSELAIDPKIIVEAVARGVDIGSVLNDLYAPLPRYRFTFMLQQALSMCAEVRAFGNTLLSILEKRDVEKLATLRAEQETRLLDQVRESKKLQIDEAEETRQGLENAARMTSARIEYYENLLAQGLISEETDQLDHLDLSNERQETASWVEATAQQLSLMPSITTGSEQTATFGGPQLGGAASAVARSYSYLSAAYAYKANRASITGSQTRRGEDWRFQRDQAKRELKQIERQLAAASIRKQIAQADLRHHETQIEHSRAIEELLRLKFTNDALYSRMQSALSIDCFQAYKAAFDKAKRAERSWRYDRGGDASFIKFGAWDSSIRGLLAGEHLYLQLKQMETAYLEHRVQEFEITKQVSVAQLDPIQLIALKETGVCEFDLPEWLFDIDYPGHYFRRLKTVSLSIPAVVGPYTSLSATLTLLSSKVRESGRIVGAYEDEENYRPDHLPVEAIAASTAQNDSGRFNLDLRDEKYLPFEGAGAISRWRIELPTKFRSFDYDTITDVVLHLRYTARRDDTLADEALTALQTGLDAAAGGALFRLFSLRHEFPGEWQMLRATTAHSATFTVAKARFPQLVQGGSISVTELHYALILKEPKAAVGYKATLTPAAGAPITFDWPGQAGRYRSAAQDVAIPIVAKPEDSGWVIQIAAPTTAADLDLVQDILIVTRYSVTM